MNVDSFANSWMPVIFKGTTNSNQRSYALWLNSGGYLQFDTSDSSGRQSYTTASGLIGVGAWHHIAGVVDRDNGSLRLWVNGVERINGSIRTGNMVQNNNPLLIGHTLESSTSYSRLAGKIDEFASGRRRGQATRSWLPTSNRSGGASRVRPATCSARSRSPSARNCSAAA
jgi:large repetitive protein